MWDWVSESPILLVRNVECYNGGINDKESLIVSILSKCEFSNGPLDWEKYFLYQYDNTPLEDVVKADDLNAY